MAAMSVGVLSLSGAKLREIQLPKVFETEIDAGLIKRAVLAMRSARVQPKGNMPWAGRLNTAEYVGARRKPQVYRTINIDRARKPRMKNRRYLISGNVASIAGVVGGPKAHPPKVEKKIAEGINRKEKRKARDAAIAASANAEMVRQRGHRVPDGIKLPIVVESKIESLKKTKEVKKVLESLRVWGDVERAKNGRKVRAGKGRMRGRRYKRAKSLLIVVQKPDAIYRAARNLEGVDVVEARNLNAELLAPGGKAGRLAVWSESAIKSMGAG